MRPRPLTIVPAGDYGFTAVDDAGRPWANASTAKRALAIGRKLYAQAQAAPRPTTDARPADVPAKYWTLCDFNGR